MLWINCIDWIVSSKFLGVRLMFDISDELSTKKLLEKSRSFYFGVKWCLHRLENKIKNQRAKQSEFLWAVSLIGPFWNNVEEWIQLPLLPTLSEMRGFFYADYSGIQRALKCINTKYNKIKNIQEHL